MNKIVDNKVIEVQMLNSIESPTISKKDVQSIPPDIDQPIEWKKITATEKCLKEIVDALIGLQTRQFSPKNKNALDNVHSSERRLVFKPFNSVCFEKLISKKNKKGNFKD